MFELVITQIRGAPPPVVHWERTVTLAVLVGATGESSARPIGTEPVMPVSGSDPSRPFILNNLEAHRKFFGKGTPMITTWLPEMSR